MKRILRHLEKPRVLMGITFVTDREIRRLNRLYRRKNRATDVLSFGGEGVPRSGTGEGAIRDLLGDVVISLDTASRQAKERRWPVRSEILFLIIHGILHLLGYDHVRHKDWVRMKKKEELLWKIVSGLFPVSSPRPKGAPLGPIPRRIRPLSGDGLKEKEQKEQDEN